MTTNLVSNFYWRIRALGFRTRRRLFDRGRSRLLAIDYRNARLTVDANEDLGWRLLRRKEYEPLEIGAVEALMRPDDTCADVGANIGLYTVFMARKCARGRVVAFEPVPGNVQLLRRNLEANGLRNVEIFEGVAAETFGTVEISVAEDAAFSSMTPTGRRRERRRERVAATTLDEVFFTPGRRLDVLKIDVEGAELLVLRGARRLLAEPRLRPRAILVELSAKNQRAYGTEPGVIVKFLEGLGYRGHTILQGGRIRPRTPADKAEDALFLLPGAQASSAPTESGDVRGANAPGERQT